MILLRIRHIDAGGRLDKYLFKFLKEAPGGFIYKMLRKKNIVLNGKKAAGSELLKENDEIKLFLADETIIKFGGVIFLSQPADSEYVAVDGDNYAEDSNSLYNELSSIKWEFDEPGVIYEDNDIMILNKPVNVLSQIARIGDLSMNEWLINYLIKKNKITKEDLLTVKPAVVNRLDRNTSGIILAGKTLTGLRFLSDIIKNGKLDKNYLTIVKGIIDKPFTSSAYLVKNNHNTVKIYDKKVDGSSLIRTSYQPISTGNGHTLLKVTLHTGKSHQIRSNLAFLGYPVIGDGKYGIKTATYKRMGLNSQFLHSFEIKFPVIEGYFSYLSEKCFKAELPERLLKVAEILGFSDAIGV